MSQYNKEELSLVIQVLLPLCLVAAFGFILSFITGEFPWITLLGASVGLAVILLSWLGKKSFIFSVALIMAAAVCTPVFHWSTF